MRTLFVLALSVFLLAVPVVSHADGNVVDKSVKVVKDNPGKSVGLAGCAAILIFPPAAAWCAATIIGGATYDGDTQKILKEVTK
ncbi:MAG: hypothetical protein ISR51_02125 [Rhodospirillales bacterium]|nr:hypothetical protein [Alphaproteobacteria bacterium]MBL6947450.1 hypothetical protein [Rhodospirillales bacterium]